ncbi:MULTISPECIES: HlyD family secretion protein [Pseudomonas]|uniref:HlyD family secretion protein n=1 Tax=Pseudomonas TaxID=286 RepID=UPI001C80653F|nr:MULTISPECIES: HlyD family secretion protein [Pseudomonas]MDG9927043.1 HlyD family secretion protein [Pseudomonas sp. GD04042]MDH0482948.1 HlyD family secretion protein [Pseudomonas sp. GD04015]MDH0602458.1 HlyD family secretion protein [Pseudomonas sp. GD03869]MDH0894155.1 HlyD family secretion protein [Pseudomonas sp. GD03875]MDH1062910.1 HlyD family secretion protein [Pseudomonas sp. GD03985]
MPAQLQRRLSIFAIVLVLIALGLFGHWLLVGRFHESTDNAYVQGEITRVSSQLGARIEKVLVTDNQQVEKGQLLLTLEAADFRLELERARAALATREAELAQAQSRLDQQGSLIAASRADVAAGQATLSRTQIDLSRAQALRKPGFVSEERVTTLSADSRVARSQLSKAEADLAAQHQQVDALQADIKRLNAQIANARADIEQAELNLRRTEIHAPISGVIGQRSARSGQVVQAGAYLLSIVPSDDIWVQANFKETQIGRMQPGQVAELTFDAYPDTPIEGRIDSLFAASGAQFSLLPPDNATGNFTKVVQRIPVKLTFAADNPLKGRIRPGMSVEVNVDISSDAQHGG